MPKDTPPVTPVVVKPEPVVKSAVRVNHLRDFVTGMDTETRSSKMNARKKRRGLRKRIMGVVVIVFDSDSELSYKRSQMCEYFVGEKGRKR